MGVSELWSLLDEHQCNELINIYQYNLYKQYNILCIDLSIWLMEAITIQYNINRKNNNKTLNNSYYIYIIYTRTIKLLQHNYKLIFVIDGKHPNTKKSHNNRKKVNKNDNNNNITTEQQNIQKVNKYWLSLTNKLKPILLALHCRIIELDIGESEQYCSLLNRIKQCNAVVSNDSDCLLYGSTNILHKFNKNNRTTCLLCNLDSTLTKLNISYNQLTILCILQRSDYSNGVHHMGIKKNYDFVCKYLNKDDSSDTVLQKMQDLLTNNDIDNCDSNNKLTTKQRKLMNIRLDDCTDDDLRLHCKQNGLGYEDKKHAIKVLTMLQNKIIQHNAVYNDNRFILQCKQYIKQSYTYKQLDTLYKHYTEPKLTVKYDSLNQFTYSIIDLEYIFYCYNQFNISFNKTYNHMIMLYLHQILYYLISNNISYTSLDVNKYIYLPVKCIKQSNKQIKTCLIEWKLTKYGQNILNNRKFVNNDNSVNQYNDINNTSVNVTKSINNEPNNEIFNIDHDNDNDLDISIVIDLTNERDDNNNDDMYNDNVYIESDTENDVNNKQINNVDNANTQSDDDIDDDNDISQEFQFTSILQAEHNSELIQHSLPELYQAMINEKQNKIIQKQQDIQQKKEQNKAEKQRKKQTEKDNKQQSILQFASKKIISSNIVQKVNKQQELYNELLIKQQNQRSSQLFDDLLNNNNIHNVNSSVTTTNDAIDNTNVNTDHNTLHSNDYNNNNTTINIAVNNNIIVNQTDSQLSIESDNELQSIQSPVITSYNSNNGIKLYFQATKQRTNNNTQQQQNKIKHNKPVDKQPTTADLDDSVVDITSDIKPSVLHHKNNNNNNVSPSKRSSQNKPSKTQSKPKQLKYDNNNKLNTSVEIIE